MPDAAPRRLRIATIDLLQERHQLLLAGIDLAINHRRRRQRLLERFDIDRVRRVSDERTVALCRSSSRCSRNEN
ncbi:hypothetical protein [Bradyrhizobium sp. USDA 4469]